MADEFNKNDGNDPLKTVLKVIGLIIVIMLGLIVVGFGLLVGVCTFGKKC